MSLFPDPAWDAMSPERPLRAYRLIEIHQTGATSLLAAPLRIDERIAAYVKGLNYLDERLAASASIIAPVDALPPSHEALAKVLDEWLAEGGARGVVQLTGPQGCAKADLVSHAAKRAGRCVFVVRADAIPYGADDLETFVRLWSRESKLIQFALLIAGIEPAEPLVGEDSLVRPRPRWPEVLTRIEAPCFLDVLRPLADLGGALSLAIDPPSPRERRALWRSALKLDDVAPDIASIARLADEFQLGVSDIEAVAARTRAALAGRKPSVDQAGDDDEDEPSVVAASVAQAWEYCAAQAALVLAGLTRWVTPRATLDDVKLPAVEKAQLERLIRHALNRAAVRSDFGFAERGGRGLGITALFHGESGTGKTFAAKR